MPAFCWVAIDMMISSLRASRLSCFSAREREVRWASAVWHAASVLWRAASVERSAVSAERRALIAVLTSAPIRLSSRENLQRANA